MPDFGFVGPSYEAPSIYQDAQECINFRPEIDPLKQPNQRGVVALYPTPGLTSKVLLSAKQQVRGMRTVSGGQFMVAVCGPYVYVLDASFVPTIVGQLNTITGQVGITDNGLNVYIVDGAYRYTWRISDPSSATFKGTISGTTLTITEFGTGTIGVNQQIFGLGVPNETVIVSGSGSTWTLSTSTTIATAIEMNSAEIAGYVTASMSGTTLTVTAISAGATIYPGQTITGSGVAVNTMINALGSGTVLSGAIAAGGTGYTVNDEITVQGGVYGTNAATFKVASVSGGVVTGVTLTYSGAYTSLPTNPVSTVSNASGTGLTLNLTFGTGSGTTGNYVISTSQTVSSRTMYLLNFTIIPTTDGAFSGGTTVHVLDNYFIYNNPDTQQWAASDILSPITYGLSYASKFTGPDNLVAVMADHGQAYLLGEQTSEVWADVGAFPFPFQRIPGSANQHGIAATYSLARIGNSFAYLSRNNRGQSEIVMMNGYFPERISNHAVENTLVNQYVADAVAYTYQLEGHECYVISFPTIDLTWVYDISSGMWHKWLWNDDNNVYHRHRSNCGALFQDLVLVGDWQNGQIYKLDPQNYTDNGQRIRRLRRAPHIVSDLQRQYFEELQIQFQPGVGLNGNSIPLNEGVVGSDPQAMLRWSNDGGSTWSSEHWTTIGKIGKYKNRAIWRRLGWSRDKIFEVVVTDPVFAVIVSANLKATQGEN